MDKQYDLKNSDYNDYNPVLQVFDVVIAIKHDYLELCKTLEPDRNSNPQDDQFYQEYKTQNASGLYESSLEYWISTLKEQKYIDLFKAIHTDQYGELVLIRTYSEREYFKLNRNDHGRTGILADDISHHIINEAQQEQMGKLWASHNGFYKECQGMVIDLKDEYMVSLPFAKIFRAGEYGEKTIEELREEKSHPGRGIEYVNQIDGTVLNATYDTQKKRLVISTADAIDDSTDAILHKARNYILMHTDYITLLMDYPAYTFQFQIVDPKIPKIVHYDKTYKLYLTGARKKADGNNVSVFELVNIICSLDVYMPLIKMPSKFDDMLSSLMDSKANDMKGVVIEVNGRFVHLISDEYAQMSKYLYEDVFDAVIESLANNEWESFYERIPLNLLNKFDRAKDEVIRSVRGIDMHLNGILDHITTLIKYRKIDNAKDIKIATLEEIAKYDESINRLLKNKYLKREVNYYRTKNGKIRKYNNLSDLYEVAMMSNEYGISPGITQGQLLRIHPKDYM